MLLVSLAIAGWWSLSSLCRACAALVAMVPGAESGQGSIQSPRHLRPSSAKALWTITGREVVRQPGETGIRGGDVRMMGVETHTEARPGLSAGAGGAQIARFAPLAGENPAHHIEGRPSADSPIRGMGQDVSRLVNVTLSHSPGECG